MFLRVPPIKACNAACANCRYPTQCARAAIGRERSVVNVGVHPKMQPFENADKVDEALCVVAACGAAGFSVASVARCLTRPRINK